MKKSEINIVEDLTSADNAHTPDDRSDTDNRAYINTEADSKKSKLLTAKETPVSIRTEKSTPNNAQKEDSPAAG